MNRGGLFGRIQYAPTIPVNANIYSSELAKFDNLLSRASGFYQKSSIINDKSDFLESKSRDDFINRMNEKLVDQAYIKYLNEPGNYYLSEKYPVFNKELNTAGLAILMSILISLFFNGLTLKKIKEF